MSTSASEVRRTTDGSPTDPDLIVVQSAAEAARTRVPVAATALTILATVLLGFVGYVGALSHVVHSRTQALAYADLREQLAAATAPIGQRRATGAPLQLGDPVALLELPGSREVIREGTTGGVLTGGPGHRRDSVLPGQAGVSVVYGRRAAFGGPFRDLTDLRVGTRFTVTTAQGRQEFRVVATRRPGDPQLPLRLGAARLTLVTAAGTPYIPSGAVRVDADLTSAVQATPPRQPVTMSTAEQPLHGNPDALVPLVLWGTALVAAACLTTWLTARWGRRQTWIVSVPLLAALGVAVAQSAVTLLPNLL